MRCRVCKPETGEVQEFVVPAFMIGYPLDFIVSGVVGGIMEQLAEKRNYGVYMIHFYTVDCFNQEEVLAKARITMLPKEPQVEIPVSDFCPN